MLSPGKSRAVAIETADSWKLSVSPAVLSLVDLKSAAVMLPGLLHRKPFRNAVCGPVGQLSCRLAGSAEIV